MIVAFLKAGCYAESGPQGIHTARLNRSTEKNQDNIAQDEAAAIAGLSGTRPLRLHVVGDCAVPSAAKILAKAVRNYSKPVWTYTHAWRNIPRRAWGSKINVLASCETVTGVLEAKRKGYATALVVDRFKSIKAYRIDSLKVIPCPQQTGLTQDCTTCKLCWDDKRLKVMDATILFQAHGVRERMVKQRLIQLS